MLRVSLPLNKTAFTQQVDGFKSAVGATARVDPSYVTVINVSEVATGRREMPRYAVQVMTNVVMAPAGVALLQSPAALDNNLAASGLPNGTLEVLSVTSNSGGNITLPAASAAAAGISGATVGIVVGCLSAGVVLVTAGRIYIVRRRRFIDSKPLSDAERDEVRKAALAGTSVVSGDSKLCEAPYELKTGRPVEAARGLEHRLNVDGAHLHHLIGMGVEGIVEEVTSFANSEGSRAEEKEVLELLNYILYEKAKEKEYPNGIRDKGREGCDLTYFETHDKAQEARLKPPEVPLPFVFVVACSFS